MRNNFPSEFSLQLQPGIFDCQGDKKDGIDEVFSVRRFWWGLLEFFRLTQGEYLLEAWGSVPPLHE